MESAGLQEGQSSCREGVVLINFRPYIERKEIQHFSTGKQESMRNIGQENIRQIDFVLRGFEEQRSIVAEIERRLSIIEEFEATVQANLTRANRLWQSILVEAISNGLSFERSQNDGLTKGVSHNDQESQ